MTVTHLEQVSSGKGEDAAKANGNIKANHNRVICKIPLLHVRCHCSFKGNE